MTIERDLIISQLDRKIASGGNGTRTVGVDMLKAVKSQMDSDAGQIVLLMNGLMNAVKVISDLGADEDEVMKILRKYRPKEH